MTYEIGKVFNHSPTKHWLFECLSRILILYHMALQAKEAMAKRKIEGVSLVQYNHGVIIRKLPSRWIGKLLDVPAVLLKEAPVYCYASSHIWRTLAAVGLVILVAGICRNLLL